MAQGKAYSSIHGMAEITHTSFRGSSLDLAPQPSGAAANLYHFRVTRQGLEKSLSDAFASLVSDGPVIALCLLVLSQVPAWFQKLLLLILIIFVFGNLRNLGERIQRALIDPSAGAWFCHGLYQLWLGMN
jgi:hypothetical protein